MIITITLNPAIDKTITIDNFTLDQVNRVNTMRLDPGGKGINVSNAIQAMGRTSRAFALIGGRAGQFIKQSVTESGIAFDSIEVDGETRTNLKIVDPQNHIHTDINELGPTVKAELEDCIINHFEHTLQEDDVLVLSGSSLPGLENNLYGKLITLVNDRGATVILDADGDKLQGALKASPHVIKPNIHELAALAGRDLPTQNDIIGYTRDLIKLHMVRIGALVSLGDQGALWITADRVLQVQPIKTEVKSTVGAGDAMVAALAVGLDEGLAEEDMLKLATAAAVARISTEGPIDCSAEKLEALARQVVISEL